MRSLLVNGHAVSYRIAAHAQMGAPLIVCLHGSGGDSSVWLSQLSGLAANCTLIAPDLPGHGKTAGQSGYGVEDYAAWLASFAEALALHSFVLMGYSMGGAIAQAFARTCPARVSGLILVSTALRFIVAPEYLAVLRKDFRRAARASCDNAYAPGVSAELYRRGLEMLMSNGGEVMYEDVLACTRFNSTGWAAKISAPGLVISGSHDTITPPEAGKGLAGALSQAKFIELPGAGHMVMQETPERFNAAVRHFLAAQR